MLWIVLTLCSLSPVRDNGGTYCGSSAQEFQTWTDACEDADGHAVQNSDGTWSCVDDDLDGGEVVVIDLNDSCSAVQACDR